MLEDLEYGLEVGFRKYWPPRISKTPGSILAGFDGMHVQTCIILLQRGVTQVSKQF